jgi:hypothetical protein
MPQFLQPVLVMQPTKNGCRNGTVIFGNAVALRLDTGIYSQEWCSRISRYAHSPGAISRSRYERQCPLSFTIGVGKTKEGRGLFGEPLVVRREFLLALVDAVDGL